MKQIMIVKPGTLSKPDKDKLTKNGIVVVEHPFPGDVRIVTEADRISGDLLLMAALKAISTYGDPNVKGEFFNAINLRIYKPANSKP